MGHGGGRRRKKMRSLRKQRKSLRKNKESRKRSEQSARPIWQRSEQKRKLKQRRGLLNLLALTRTGMRYKSICAADPWLLCGTRDRWSFAYVCISVCVCFLC